MRPYVLYLGQYYIIFGTKLYRQFVLIPMSANCAPLIADVFYTATKEISWILFTMKIEAFNATFRYLGDL